MSRIRVSIDELALKGFEAADARVLVDVLRSELARVLSDPLTRAGWARSRRTPVLRIGAIPKQTGTSGSRKFARGLANAIGKGMTR